MSLSSISVNQNTLLQMKYQYDLTKLYCHNLYQYYTFTNVHLYMVSVYSNILLHTTYFTWYLFSFFPPIYFTLSWLIMVMTIFTTGVDSVLFDQGVRNILDPKRTLQAEFKRTGQILSPETYEWKKTHNIINFHFAASLNFGCYRWDTRCPSLL